MSYPNARSELTEQVQCIRSYTAAHPELAACHHFCFDFRLGAFTRAEFVVLGLNPGETDDDRAAAPAPAEESSLVDYRDGRDSKSRARWFDTCRRIVGSDRISLTELCFWSSPTIGALEARIGPLARSPHLRFCQALNDELIDFHQPQAVVLPGLGLHKLVQSLYALEHVRSVPGRQGRSFIEHYERGGRPWVFTRHWSGSFGFSNEDKDGIGRYLRSL